MALSRALFRSTNAEWATPAGVFARLHREFQFTLDVCATRRNHKCPRYFTPRQNGLRRRWTGTCWMNPPYGRAIGAWVRKAAQAAREGATVVCLLPARTDTAWWQDGVMRAEEIRLVRGRITFVGAVSPAPFPSAIAIFRSASPTRAPRVVPWTWRPISRSQTPAKGLGATASAIRVA